MTANNMNDICFECGKPGHKDANCPKVVSTKYLIKRIKINRRQHNNNAANDPNSNVYVTNLPRDYGKDRLLKLFATYGQIVRYKIIETTKHAYGFVQFAHPINAHRAIKSLEGHVFKTGDTICLSIALRGSSLLDKPTNLYVKNVPSSWKNDTLRKVFGRYGPIRQSKVDGSGIAFVRFEHHSQALNAIRKLDKQMVAPGCKLHVSFATRQTASNAYPVQQMLQTKIRSTHAEDAKTNSNLMTLNNTSTACTLDVNNILVNDALRNVQRRLKDSHSELYCIDKLKIYVENWVNERDTNIKRIGTWLTGFVDGYSIQPTGYALITLTGHAAIALYARLFCESICNCILENKSMKQLKLLLDEIKGKQLKLKYPFPMREMHKIRRTLNTQSFHDKGYNQDGELFLSYDERKEIFGCVYKIAEWLVKWLNQN